jgi:hypothetical protein
MSINFAGRVVVVTTVHQSALSRDDLLEKCRQALFVRGLHDCVLEGRQEILGAFAAWLPQLHRMAGTTLLDKLDDVHALMGIAVGEPEIPNILPERLRGAQYRAFNLR